MNYVIFYAHGIWSMDCENFDNRTDFDDHQTELQEQIKEAEEINNLSTNSTMPPTSLALSYETHSEAIYTSKLLDFNNLPEPKNSDDYYKRYDNIISEEYSGNDRNVFC